MSDETKFFASKAENEKLKNEEIRDENDKVISSTDLVEDLNHNHQVIHKKNGRLHIYVRQDKYKGELKSKNWVGRAYISGKQMVYSSGTPDLDDAIPILERWYDEKLQNSKELDENDQKNSKNPVFDKNNQDKSAIQSEVTLFVDEENENRKNSEKIQLKIESDNHKQKGFITQMFEKLKNFNFGKKKDESNADKLNQNIGEGKKKKSFSLKNIFKSKVSKLSVSGEEIAGLDITKEAIKVSQVSQDKDEKWILDKFSYRLLDQEKISENVLQNKDYIAEEISLALANAKITSKNIAMSIPVTSAIIKVVTSPLMSDEELQKAIDTDSLWENLVQLTDNLNDYSIFHQVINRSSKTNTMDILFVASKLSDVNEYSNIVKKAGLNPVIIDVRCFTLKNAHDNTEFKSIVEKTSSAILELGPEENYLMIIHNNIPIITDVFLRQPEKEMLSSVSEQSNPEAEAVIRRYAMQVKQALADYEAKYENKINNIQVVSSMKNISNVLTAFTKNLPTIGFHLFDPLQGVQIPSYNSEKTSVDNRSTFASVIGLAYRKLDVFGYYKFVTAVKNINLLPNRETVRQKGRLKFLTGFAFKGIAGLVAAIYLILIVTSYFQIKSNNEILNEYDQVQIEYDQLNAQFSKLIKRKREIDKSLELWKLVNSNQVQSYRALAQIARSVPLRVNFTNLKFDGQNNIIITGLAFADQDILNFISNLNSKSLIAQASLTNMQEEAQDQNSNSKNMKRFTINCLLKGN